MSSIYIQEPPTHGKVLLETSVGDIDIELWSKEAPKACRNFVQLCLENYYDGTIFHRVVKDFIVQGGDPSGTGLGGESIYGQPFKDEFHTRLRFVRRGLLAMANAGKDDNGSQFFFTFAPCPELQNKHTIFGKVAGNTIYNMLKLEEGIVDNQDRPLYPHKINATKVLYNPFDDIVPRNVKTKLIEAVDVKNKSTATKNFKLLSFGDEAEEDEEEADVVAQEYRGKSKSSHDLTNDPHLSSLTSLPLEEPKDSDESEIEDDELDLKVSEVRKKLKREGTSSKDTYGVNRRRDKKPKLSSPDQAETQKNNLDDIRKEVRKLKQEMRRDLHKSKQDEKNTLQASSTFEQVDEDDDKDIETPADDDTSDYLKLTKHGFKNKKNKNKDAKGNHEDQTLLMLERFKAKLQSAKDSDVDASTAESHATEKADDDESDVGWLTHTLNFESRETIAKDANLSNEDTFEIYDPRNPINQRRREVSKEVMKNKKSGNKFE